MSTEKHQIIVNDLVIDVFRKDINNLHLSVYPPDGGVRVSAPLRVNDDAVKMAVISRLPWIRKQQRKFTGQERQSPREYVSGESHYFQGNRYLLNVIYHDGPPRVDVYNKSKIDLYVRNGSDKIKRQKVVQGWYRRELKATVPPLISKWENIVGVDVANWRIKRMKTKWGTCNIHARRIWLNLELAKWPVHCLEYIIVHEMVHLLERLHNDNFVAYMDKFMPQWRLYRDELNRGPLGHAEWGY